MVDFSYLPSGHPSFAIIIIFVLQLVKQDAPAKKQVRFNMERNKEYFYSYGVASDDDNHHDLMSNVNFVNYKFNGSGCYNEDDDDDDDDDDDEEDDDSEEDYSDQNGQESSEDDSRSDKYGYLVDKSNTTSELNNNSSDLQTSLKSTKLNGTIDSVNGVTDSVGKKLLNGPLQHQDIQNDKLYEDKRLVDLRSQVWLIICTFWKLTTMRWQAQGFFWLKSPHSTTVYKQLIFI